MHSYTYIHIHTYIYIHIYIYNTHIHIHVFSLSLKPILRMIPTSTFASGPCLAVLAGTGCSQSNGVGEPGDGAGAVLGKNSSFNWSKTMSFEGPLNHGFLIFLHLWPLNGDYDQWNGFPYFRLFYGGKPLMGPSSVSPIGQSVWRRACSVTHEPNELLGRFK